MELRNLMQVAMKKLVDSCTGVIQVEEWLSVAHRPVMGILGSSEQEFKVFIGIEVIK